MIIYYTDWNDVDEDLMAITQCGGRWPDNNQAGIVNRYVNNTYGTDVASMCRHL